MSNSCSFAYHNAGSMIQHNSTAKCRVRVQVDLKYLRDLTLQILRQYLPTTVPQFAGNPMRLQCMESFEIKEHILFTVKKNTNICMRRALLWKRRQRRSLQRSRTWQCIAGWIPVSNCHDVGAKITSKYRAPLQRFIDQSLKLS